MLFFNMQTINPEGTHLQYENQLHRACIMIKCMEDSLIFDFNKSVVWQCVSVENLTFRNLGNDLYLILHTKFYQLALCKQVCKT